MNAIRRTALGLLLLAACSKGGDSPECSAPGDCAAPGPCEVAAGASCTAGRCVYAPLVCDAPPAAECVAGDTVHRSWASPGICDPGTGACSHEQVDVACPDCQRVCLGLCDGVTCDQLEHGCRTSGACLPGAPARCEYQHAADDTACDDGDPCTAGDHCAAGACATVPIADGQACEGASGVCAGGACVECADATQCDDGNPCTQDVCEPGHACSHSVLAGAACDDSDACTYDDACGADATCAGTVVVCQSDVGVCGAMRSCDGTSTCTEVYPGAEEPCDDGAACTFSDRCDGAGACSGTAIVCASDPGPCGVVRTCDGTPTCTATYPGGSVACDDGRGCSITDRCDGAGGCSGWPLMPDRAPLAMVDSDITGVLGQALRLDATYAADPDAWCGDAVVKYEWDLDGDGAFELQPAGAVATLPWADVVAYGFSVADPAALWQPAYDVAVRVTDQWGVTGVQPATLRICDRGLVAVPSVVPATAGCGVSMTFDGGGSYALEYTGRRVTSYRWDLDVAADSSGNGNPGDDVDAMGSRVTYRYSRAGTHRARLTVTDDLGTTASADVDSTSSIANGAPVAVTGGPYVTVAGGPINLDGSASYDPDPPCDAVSAWRWDTDGDDLYGADDTNGSALCGATDCTGSVVRRVVDPAWLAGHSYRVAVIVVDAYGRASAPAESTISVVPSPASPAVVLVSPAGGEVLRGTADVRFKVSHPSGQQVTLELRLNDVAIPFNGSAAVAPPADGSQVDVVRTFDTTSYANAFGAYTLEVIAKLTAQPAVTGQAVSRAFSIDNGAPFVSLPAGETAPVLEVVALDGTPFTFHPTVSDSLDPAPSLVTSPVLSRYPLGTTPVTFTAFDWAGNVATRNVNVGVRDTTPPSLSLPAPGLLTAVVQDASGAKGLFWLPEPTASDLGTPPAALLASTRVWMTLRNAAGAAVPPPAGGYALRDPTYAALYFPPGDTSVRYRVTDSSGNYAEATLTVRVGVQAP